MNRKLFMFLTTVVVLSFIYFHSKESFTLYRVKVVGDEKFVESVKAGFYKAKLNFDLVNDSDIVLNQENLSFRFKDRIFHLSWSSDTVDRVKKELSLLDINPNDVEFVPMFGWENVFEGVAKIIKGEFSGVFSNRYLAIPLKVVSADGKTLLIYDPLSETFDYISSNDSK